MPKNPVALNTKPNDFRIGERVRIGKFTNQQLESMQEQHGGFNPKMLEVLNLVGEVHRLTSNGDVRVQYPGDPATSYRWTVSYDTHNKVQICVVLCRDFFRAMICLLAAGTSLGFYYCGC